jgi:hypothetical protein
MGTGLSSNKMQKQESFVQQNFAKEKSRISFIKNVDGTNRYSDEQIKMKLRQDYKNSVVI